MPFGVWFDSSTAFTSSCSSEGDPVSLSRADCDGTIHAGFQGCATDSDDSAWLRWTDSGDLTGELVLGGTTWSVSSDGDLPTVADFDAGESVNLFLDVRLEASGEETVERTVELSACVMPTGECPQ